MRYFLGFDGGGTKTECVLIDEHGSVLASAHGDASNPLRTGYPKAWFALGATADLVLARVKIKATDVAGIQAGLGGAGRIQVARRVTAFFEQSFPNAAVHVTSDLEIALMATAGSGPAVVLIAGTGSSALGRNAEGLNARAGGLGPWLGDEGSAFDIGRRGLATVLVARDLRGPETLLSGRVLRELNCYDWDCVFDSIVKNPDSVFPRLFPLVASVAQEGDEVAREILTHAAKALAELVRSVVEKLHMSAEEFPLAKVGGVFGRSPQLDRALEKELASVAPKARVGPPRLSPARAAAEMALNARGETAHAR